MIDASHPRPGAQGAATVNVRTQEDWFRFLTRLVPVSDSDIRGQALKELLESDDKFGFIIMDGNGFGLPACPLRPARPARASRPLNLRRAVWCDCLGGMRVF